ncbi:MAG TPA: hypothetical protein VHO92_03940 [Methanobacterium sp.]|nr:hypothetical protein [Methanobacterium sp.]
MNNRREYLRNRWFTFPYSNLIWPLVIGIILICAGLSDLIKIDIWHYIWPTIAIVLGILIIIGGIFGSKKRY